MKFKLLLFSLLIGCSSPGSSLDSPKSSVQGESFDLKKVGVVPLLEEPRYIGGDSEELFRDPLEVGYWDIPKTAYNCRGSKMNSSRFFANIPLEDCSGLHESVTGVHAKIQMFLNHFQATYHKRLKVLIGWRCEEHERFIQAKESYQNGNKVIVRLEGVTRQELKELLEKLAPSKWSIVIKDVDFSLEDQDLWGESQTVQILLK